ncbi:MAG TPA: sigma-70 family RNA polymerase sigma factor [Armatimonadota bacterium]|jgi:RNA polymerase sigma-B factor
MPTRSKQAADHDLPLLVAWQDRRDPAARCALVRRHEELVRRIAWRYRGTGEAFEDLIQEGYIGLLRAIDLYDPAAGARFSSYAACKIHGSIQHSLRDRGQLIRQPAWVQEIQHRKARERERLTQVLGREPTNVELAASLGLEEEEVARLQHLQAQTDVLSLDASLWDDCGGESFSSRMEAVADPESQPGYPSLDDRLAVSEALDRLPKHERAAVRLFFFEGMSYTDTARTLGLSYPTARQLVVTALRRLRGFLLAN